MSPVVLLDVGLEGDLTITTRLFFVVFLVLLNLFHKIVYLTVVVVVFLTLVLSSVLVVLVAVVLLIPSLRHLLVVLVRIILLLRIHL